MMINIAVCHEIEDQLKFALKRGRLIENIRYHKHFPFLPPSLIKHKGKGGHKNEIKLKSSQLGMDVFSLP